MEQRSLMVFILIFNHLLAFESIFAKSKTADENSVDIFISGPPVCICYALNVGAVFDKNIIGANWYRGALPFHGGGSQYGIFMRSFPWENSFFVTSRLGWMKTQIGHPNYKSDSGMAAGVDIGNQWIIGTGFTHGFTWIGLDFYLLPARTAGLPHGLRYEIGWQI